MNMYLLEGNKSDGGVNHGNDFKQFLREVVQGLMRTRSHHIDRMNFSHYYRQELNVRPQSKCELPHSVTLSDSYGCLIQIILVDVKWRQPKSLHKINEFDTNS
ncbi:unnamed protein product [Cuscuta europaea]|uniref:Uncharacterized protein n=1 Tax=Cuscuta europaea TaxID=41803 RepID=A0A9P1E995_CUSEU|nr:unnamed protein product [Cuscuta europaea]